MALPLEFGKKLVMQDSDFIFPLPPWPATATFFFGALMSPIATAMQVSLLQGVLHIGLVILLGCVTFITSFVINFKLAHGCYKTLSVSAIFWAFQGIIFLGCTAYILIVGAEFGKLIITSFLTLFSLFLMYLSLTWPYKVFVHYRKEHLKLMVKIAKGRSSK